MRAKEYPLLVEAVECGVARGWRRAYKHTDAPTEETVRDTIIEEVIGEVCERFELDEKAVSDAQG
jgi:hypothetical protein